jgi:hypothetical protein
LRLRTSPTSVAAADVQRNSQSHVIASPWLDQPLRYSRLFTLLSSTLTFSVEFAAELITETVWNWLIIWSAKLLIW